MFITVSANALKKVFMGGADDHTMACLKTNTIVMSESIREEYHREVGDNEIYLAWFPAMQQFNLIEMVDEEDYCQYEVVGEHIVDGVYLGASYLAGMLTVESEGKLGEGVQSQIFGKYGVKVCGVERAANEIMRLPQGRTRIVEDMVFSANKWVKMEEIERFFRREKSLVVYDRFVGDRAVKAIGGLLRNTEFNANIFVVSTEDKLKKEEIREKLKDELPHAQVEVGVPTRETYRKYHDRWIFAGKRLEVFFSKGMDSFYRSGPLWYSEDSRVAVYSVYSSREQKVFKLVDGGVVRVQAVVTQ